MLCAPASDATDATKNLQDSSMLVLIDLFHIKGSFLKVLC